jgi:hypothetical protein
MIYINTILLEHFIYIHLIIITCIAIPGNKLLCLMSYVLAGTIKLRILAPAPFYLLQTFEEIL